ncbi:unnamed protein product [Miscanthus lutarioriparius]|uniref:BHLH domain-containing protein n=1 Tax=Miscanthus lutarioriparius TaxID=422564 RepID=A0A811MNE7_9POAL|nr:unnamed protein product [Miscanthus lutarioriparius]
MDGNTRSAAAIQKKPIVADDDLIELLWHNGSVVAQPQAHHRPAPSPSDRDRPGTSGLTGEETAAWFPDTLDDALEKDLYTQLWYSTIADAAPQHEGMLPGPTSQPSPLPPVGNSGVDSSWAGDICSTFCGSNQVPRTPAGTSGKDAALQSEGPSGAGAHDGTSSSGGSGSNYGGSGLPSDSVHVHKRKGRCRDDSDSPSEDAECEEATEETKPSRRHGPKRRTRAAEVHNLSERRRRDRINEKMRALQELIPHCNKTDKASILDETIEYLKSLQMQVQIMWMTSGMAPMMFPGAHQFMPPMALGMNSGCIPAAQGLSQMPRLPYMSHPLPNHIPLNSSPAMNPMNPLNAANQMQNGHLREASNHFLHLDGRTAVIPQVPGPHVYGHHIAQAEEPNNILEVAASTVVPTSRAGQPPTFDGV